jgi:hypothetical protein
LFSSHLFRDQTKLGRGFGPFDVLVFVMKHDRFEGNLVDLARQLLA